MAAGRSTRSEDTVQYEEQWLDEVAAGTEKGIRDTYAWKEAVRRFGLKEARKRLRLGLLTSRLPDLNPLN